MSADAPIPDDIALECRAFARFLANSEATPYVMSHYARLRPTAALSETTSARIIERGLLAAARLGSLPLRMADGYARFFLPRALLRRRLLLLLAILENSPGSERHLNSSIEGSLPMVGLRVMEIGRAHV